MAELTERPVIGVTVGDPAGIGPEVVIKAGNSVRTRHGRSNSRSRTIRGASTRAIGNVICIRLIICLKIYTLL